MIIFVPTHFEISISVLKARLPTGLFLFKISLYLYTNTPAMPLYYAHFAGFFYLIPSRCSAITWGISFCIK